MCKVSTVVHVGSLVSKFNQSDSASDDLDKFFKNVHPNFITKLELHTTGITLQLYFWAYFFYNFISAKHCVEELEAALKNKLEVLI